MPQLSQKRIQLKAFIAKAGGYRPAAKMIGCSISTLNTLVNGKSKASPELAAKLCAKRISTKGLVARCKFCRSIRRGPYCPNCEIICIERRGVKPLAPLDNTTFYAELKKNMERRGDDPFIIEAVTQRRAA